MTQQKHLFVEKLLPVASSSMDVPNDSIFYVYENTHSMNSIILYYYIWEFIINDQGGPPETPLIQNRKEREKKIVLMTVLKIENK